MGATCTTGHLKSRTRDWLDLLLPNRQSDRGPVDFPDPQTDRERLEDLIRKTVRASVSISGGYHEGGNGTESWQKWILLILASLVVASVVGGVTMYGQLSALTAKVESLQVQVDRVQKLVEPRYRGG